MSSVLKMNLNETLSKSECALSEIKHIFYNPIQLSCKHYACQACIGKNHQILCKHCSKYCTVEKEEVSQEAQSLFLGDMQGFVSQFNEKYKTTLEEVFNIHETINSCFKYIEENIEIRIECMKIEVHKQHEKLINNVDEYGKKLKRKTNDETEIIKNKFEQAKQKSLHKTTKYVKRTKLLRKKFQDKKKLYNMIKFNPSCIDINEIKISQVGVVKPELSEPNEHNEPTRAVVVPFYVPFDNTCWECGEYGHYRYECPDIICHNCFEQGHMARDCQEYF